MFIGPSWFDRSAFGRLSGNSNQQPTKGNQLYVESQLKSRIHQTQAEETRHSNDIHVTEVLFLGQGGGSGSGDGVLVAPLPAFTVIESDKTWTSRESILHPAEVSSHVQRHLCPWRNRAGFSRDTHPPRFGDPILDGSRWKEFPWRFP
jgi:hypothetical protein